MRALPRDRQFARGIAHPVDAGDPGRGEAVHARDCTGGNQEFAPGTLRGRREPVVQALVGERPHRRDQQVVARFERGYAVLRDGRMPAALHRKVRTRRHRREPVVDLH